MSRAATSPRQPIRKAPPASFATPLDEYRWYERNVSEARELRDHMRVLHEHMVSGTPPPSPEVLAQVEDDQRDLDAWIRELEEKLASLAKPVPP